MKKSILTIALLATGLVACSKENAMPTPHGTAPSDASSPVAEAASSPAATMAIVNDWEGKYTGELPCADCDGIKTELQLFKNHTYELKEVYVGRDKKPFVTKGKITFDQANIATLHNKSEDHQYLVEENQITALDMEGKKIDGDMASMYILKKVK